MWWILGFCAIVILVFLFSKLLLTSLIQTKLVQAGVNHIFATFRLLNGGDPNRLLDGRVDERVWHDPYLLGYSQGVIALMMAPFGARLSTLQKGWVGTKVMQQLTADRWEEVRERVRMLRDQHNTEYFRGEEHGSNVSILIANGAGPGLLADPDVQMALREAPALARDFAESFGITNLGQSGAAGAWLMQYYMERHRQEAGY